MMLPKYLRYVYTYYACMKLGAVVVQMNPLYTPREVEFILNDSGAKKVSATEQEIKDFLVDKLAKYKVPRRIEFRSELPKSAIGKILRRELIAEEKKKKEKGG